MEITSRVIANGQQLQSKQKTKGNTKMSNDWTKYIHVNCRTCAHSTAKADSTWRCERHDADGIPIEFQRNACDSHVLHPDLVPWQQKDGLDDWTAVYVIDGKDVANGEGDAHVFTSREILANPSACANPGEQLLELREQFDGRVVG